MSTREFLLPPISTDPQQQQWYAVLQDALERLDLRTSPVVSVEAFGAQGDGTTDDTAAIQAAVTAAAAVNGTVTFPPGTTHLVSETIYGAQRIRWSFNNTTLKASDTGTYDSILGTGGADTGLDVFFSVDGGAGSIYHGRLFLDGDQVSNLCGISGHDSDLSGFQIWEHVRISSCERGIYAVNNQNQNTLVGHRFGFLEFFSNGYDIYVEGIGADDAQFGEVRSNGSAFAADANKANIYLEDSPASLVIHSLFLNGQRSDRNGLVLDNGVSFVCDHMFVEHDFDAPIRARNSNNILRVESIKVSPAFTSANQSIIEIQNNDLRGYYDIAFADGVQNSSGVSVLVRIDSTTGTKNRVVRIRLPIGTGAVTPVEYTGGGTGHDELVEAIATNGVFRYFYDGSTTTEIRQDTFAGTLTESVTTPGSVTGAIEVFDTAGTSLGFLPIYDSIT